MSAGPPIAFSTLAFPGASVATALSLGGAWGYGGVELRLIDRELIDPSMPAAARAEARRAAAAAGLPIVAVDSSIRLTGENPGPRLRQFLARHTTRSPPRRYWLSRWRWSSGRSDGTQRNRGAEGGFATAP